MKKSIRYLSVLLATMMCLTTGWMPVLASSESPEAYNQAIAKRKSELESKYGINIQYGNSSNGKAIVDEDTLETLDTVLAAVSPSVVKQLSSYLKGKSGKALTFSYTSSTADFRTSHGLGLASYVESQASIKVYVPRSGSTDFRTGSSPLALTHELGHVFYSFFTDKYGASRFKSQWVAHNGSYSYSSGYINNNPDNKIFASAYGATDFEEDFADTFAQAFVCNKAGLSIAGRLTNAQGARTGLGNKVGYLSKMLPMYMDNTEAAVANLQKAYSAPARTSFEGLSLSGNSLEFIGYPSPKGVGSGLMKSLGIDYKTVSWQRAIGGWRVVDTSGKTYLVFPDGAYTRL